MCVKTVKEKIIQVLSLAAFLSVLTITGPFGELGRYSVRRHPTAATRRHKRRHEQDLKDTSAQYNSTSTEMISQLIQR